MSGNWLAPFVTALHKPQQYIRLEPTDQPRPVLVTFGRKGRHLRRSNNIQFCPLCLQEKRFYSLAWSLNLTPICLQHHCLLLGREHLDRPHLHLTDIFTFTLHELEMATQQLIFIDPSDPGYAAQQLLLSWFDFAPFPVSMQSDLATLPSTVPPHILYGLVYGLYNYLLRQPVPDHDPKLHSASSPPISSRLSSINNPHSYLVVGAAVDILFNWPDNFYAFLDLYQTDAKQPRHRFGTLFNYYLETYWQHPAFQFIFDAFNHYLHQRFNYSHHFSHTKPEVVNDPHTISTQQQYTRAQTCQLLALDRYVIRELVQLELLKSISWESIPKWRFRGEDLLAFLNQLDRHCQPVDPAIQYLRFSEASLRASYVDCSQTQLLVLVIEGKIPAYTNHQPLTSCSQLLFDPQQLQDYVVSTRQQNGWLTRHELAQQLQVSALVVSRWVQMGIIQPIHRSNKILYFNTHTIQTFHETYIIGSALAAAWGISTLHLYNLAASGQVPARSGRRIDGAKIYLFERQKVAPFQHRYGSRPDPTAEDT